MQNWVALIRAENLRADHGPKYAAIADALRGAIHSGELRPGERLPAQRDLAAQLGVDLTTVTRAYTLVREAGLIEGAGKLGSFVRNDIALPRFGETASDRGMNVPPQPGFNLLPQAIHNGMASLLRAGRHSPILQYQPSLGNIADRAQGAERLAAAGLPSEADQIAITAGAQHALHGLVHSIMEPGDRLCCAPFIYPGMIALARRRGLVLTRVNVDDEGLIPDALDAALRGGARAVYLTPTNDNPTCITMGLRRREEIAAVIVTHGATLIEDDAYGQLCRAAHPPCAALIPAQSWYIAGTSKLISPVLRVAHVRAPSAEQNLQFGAALGDSAVMAPPLNVALVSHWLREGLFGALIDGVRAEAVTRHRLVTRHLTGLPYRMQPEGYHLWLDLRDTSGRAPDIDTLIDVLGGMGLSAVAGSAFATEDGTSTHIRLSVGGALDHGAIERALRHLRDRLVC
ncbi:DNA-binding transcriptional MocR family regulator [Sphingobium sp. B2D3A]|uniref:aminotransferase-like domain-containing protein n=1 Tax=unclassified Sphingobium TaxID=2611147 RepID=UPI0022242E9B|nr:MULTISPECIES: PLP-dependent aminotransferase family protein [unclassified Sphingobium]MCW2338715.1 DNA-binding transcriptional MocR family regulator [Sphingobium sp. B2D3A]MCW2385173.1 DNA-binding transcriptional MocR family regulator [Sphingobium sp. B2D3D]